MYTEFYRLTGRPFQLSPNHRFFFGSRGHRRAMSYLTYGLHQGEGFIVITGDVGTGKTTLVGYLCEQLASGPFVAARIACGQLDADQVLRAVARALKLEPGDVATGKADLLARLEALLLEHAGARHRVLLIADEAQNLPPPALEELRVLSNLQGEGGRALLQILLVGQPQLKRTLADAELEQLRQRVIASCHLEPLDAAEVRAYVEHRLGKVGWAGDPAFDDGAFEAIDRFTGGVPRRINLLCDRLLVYGALEGRHDLDAVAVAEVVAELEQEGASFAPQDGAIAAVAGPPPDHTEAGLPALEGAAGSREATFPATAWEDVEHWRRETVRLQRKLEHVYDRLTQQHGRTEDLRAEAERLKVELHRIQVEGLRAEAEASRRELERLREKAPAAAGQPRLFRRLAGCRT
jgi:putative secretion ATPase (PEP-CTERM system associated)